MNRDQFAYGDDQDHRARIHFALGHLTLEKTEQRASVTHVQRDRQMSGRPVQRLILSQCHSLASEALF